MKGVRKMKVKCPEHHQGCKSPDHEVHLCYFVSQGFNTSNEDEYKWMIGDPKFRCEHCRRNARCAENLCEPVEL